MNENNNTTNNIPSQGGIQPGAQPGMMPPPMVGQGTYGPMPYTSYVKPVKEPTVFTKPEKIFALITVVLAFLFIQFAIWNVTGYFTTLFYIIMLTAVNIYLHKTDNTFMTSHKVWAAVMYLFSTVFSITANNTIKSLNVIFLQIGIAYLVYCVTHDTKPFGRFAVFEIVKGSVADPLSHFDKEFSAINSTAKDSHTGKNIKSLLIGIIIALPLTLIVGGLLMSADAGVEHMLSGFLNFINIGNFFSFIAKLIFTLPAAGYLFGLLYSHTHKDKTKQLTEEYCDKACKDARKISNTVMYTAVTPICILYVMFFISQVNYFLSAFRGILPEEYDYSQYARRGFFELFAIELINAAVIFFINFFAKKTGEEKPAALKIYTVVISVFTLIITATAISKMALYISNCGLTQLRVYTTWFMVLTAFMFIYVIIKQFKKDLSIIKPAAVTFVLMFGLLCFSRPDALIAKYNLEFMGNSLTGRDIEVMNNMSADSQAVLVDPKYANIISSITSYEEVCRYAKNGLDKTPYNEFNLSAAIIRSRLH